MKRDVTSKNKISKKREDMSRLDELIKELCPNGVEYKKLGDLNFISTCQMQTDCASWYVHFGILNNTFNR